MRPRLWDPMRFGDDTVDAWAKAARKATREWFMPEPWLGGREYSTDIDGDYVPTDSFDFHRGVHSRTAGGLRTPMSLRLRAWGGNRWARPRRCHWRLHLEWCRYAVPIADGAATSQVTMLRKANFHSRVLGEHVAALLAICFRPSQARPVYRLEEATGRWEPFYSTFEIDHADWQPNSETLGCGLFFELPNMHSRGGDTHEITYGSSCGAYGGSLYGSRARFDDPRELNLPGWYPAVDAAREAA